MAKKPSIGRQKIKIAKIEVKNHLQVTFSKRRSGLFKKASELCTLCGVEIAILVFSPAGKIFSFGHPNVESIVDRFLTQNPNPDLCSNPLLLFATQSNNARVSELNLHLDQILNELEMERERGERLDNMRKTNVSQYWWEAPVKNLGLQELEQLKEAMEELKRNVDHQHASKLNEAATTSYNPSSSSAGFLDMYETKPNLGDSIDARLNNGFGYCHGFF